ncbi:hypothetical protein RISK_000549 [Rhodopirellula islandica]|uniref:Uncharacterized protein n=1 Tax=Rhodopirellula islandica TaxID=595434 RepID=A0A0J1BLR8_RHOIS|nr:hypothetical protein RISK_000549 [Rhodopirellula islandica]
MSIPKVNPRKGALSLSVACTKAAYLRRPMQRKPLGCATRRRRHAQRTRKRPEGPPSQRSTMAV